MPDINEKWVEGEIWTLRIRVSVYDESQGTEISGTGEGKLNLGEKDIYVEVFDWLTHSSTPVLQKNRISGNSTTGLGVAEDADNSYLDIDWRAGDYAATIPGLNTDGVSERRYELRAKYKVGTSDEKSILPYRDKTTKEWKRYFFDLIPKGITA